MFAFKSLRCCLGVGLLLAGPALAHADEEAARIEAPDKAQAPAREEIPASSYEFKESPAQAIEVLQKLQSSTLDVRISPAEAELFEDARDGKLDEHTFAEAVLLASGVQDADQRREFLKRIDRLEAQARKATARGKTPFEKAELLLTWLHAGPMSGGYSKYQTDVSKILDEKTFNCVSSAALYNILGRRLGLDLRAIEVPDHAFSILYVGNKRADVETTTPEGFNPSRDPDAKEEISRTTGFHYIPEQHADQRREVGEAGLAAIIYYNHGVGLLEEHRYHESLLANFRALSLDAGFDSAVKNVLAGISKWSNELAEQGQYSESLNILSTGLSLAPEDGTLLNNRTVVWCDWARASMKAGRPDEAIDVLHRAAQAVTAEADHFAELESWLFIEPGEALADAHDWQAALLASEPGLEKLTGKPRQDVLEWRLGVHLRWSEYEIEQHQFADAARVLEEARQVAPDDSRLQNGLCYVMQEWLRYASETQQGEEFERTLAELLKRFENVKDASEVASNHILRQVIKLRDDGKFDQALATVEQYAPVLTSLTGDEKQVNELRVDVYCRRARTLIEAQDWEAAFVTYETALQQLPDNYDLLNDLSYRLQERIKAVYDAEGEASALKLVNDLVTRFETLKEVKEVAENHALRVVHKLRSDGKFEEALAAMDRHADLLRRLDKADDIQDLAESVYDSWADTFMDQHEWSRAIEIYEQGLRQYKDSSHLENNLAYCRQQAEKEGK